MQNGTQILSALQLDGVIGRFTVERLHQWQEAQPLTGILDHSAAVYSSRADSLILEIVQLGGTKTT